MQAGATLLHALGLALLHVLGLALQCTPALALQCTLALWVLRYVRGMGALPPLPLTEDGRPHPSPASDRSCWGPNRHRE